MIANPAANPLPRHSSLQCLCEIGSRPTAPHSPRYPFQSRIAVLDAGGEQRGAARGASRYSTDTTQQPQSLTTDLQNGSSIESEPRTNPPPCIHNSPGTGLRVVSGLYTRTRTSGERPLGPAMERSSTFDPIDLRSRSSHRGKHPLERVSGNTEIADIELRNHRERCAVLVIQQLEKIVHLQLLIGTVRSAKGFFTQP